MVTVMMLPRRFALHRRRDLSGVSGTGLVAFGTTYPTGRTTLAWCVGDVPSVTVYDSADQVLQIHGHDGATDLVWIDGPNRQHLDIQALEARDQAAAPTDLTDGGATCRNACMTNAG